MNRAKKTFFARGLFFFPLNKKGPFAYRNFFKIMHFSLNFQSTSVFFIHQSQKIVSFFPEKKAVALFPKLVFWPWIWLPSVNRCLRSPWLLNPFNPQSSAIKLQRIIQSSKENFCSLSFLLVAIVFADDSCRLFTFSVKYSIFRNGNSYSWRSRMVTQWHNYEINKESHYSKHTIMQPSVFFSDLTHFIAFDWRLFRQATF